MTTTLPRPPASPPAPASPAAPGRRGVGWRSKRPRDDTPRTLTLLSGALVAVCLVFGLVGVLTVRARSEATRDMVTRSEPLAVSAQEIYRALSDADATAAGAFLAGGLEPAAARDRYQRDIAQATAALSDASADASGSAAARAALAEITARLPVYTGLVETARANNRQGFPVGAAYLREASGLMRSSLLPAAQRLYDVETGRLAEDHDRATALPWVEILLGLLTLALLAAAQRYLTRRTNRWLNVGLVGAAAAVVVSLLWVAVAFDRQGGYLERSSREGSAQVDVLAQARFAALAARADESLTLVARGDGGSYEKDFTRVSQRLGGADGAGGLLGTARGRATDSTGQGAAQAAIGAYKDWLTAHRSVRGLDDGGQYDKAVDIATGPSRTGAANAFGRLDGELARAIQHGQDGFGRTAARARGALSGAVYALAALALAAAACCALGIRQRLREYR